MTDWRAIAKARGFEIPEPELDRIVSVLTQLETDFRPISGTLPIETEPATIFRPIEEEL